MTRPALTRLAGDRRGATIIEFAIVLPVMLLMIMGFMELAYQAYVQSVLSGSVRKAGRDAGIEGGATRWTSIDAAVLSSVTQVSGTASIVSSSHFSYSSFTNVKVREPFTDQNGDGKYDAATDCFTDINGNQTWDADQGMASNQGGASDVAMYTLKIQYTRLFPLLGWLGWPSIAQLSASTIMKNQPYATQAAATPKKCCPNVGCS